MQGCQRNDRPKLVARFTLVSTTVPRTKVGDIKSAIDDGGSTLR